jgi:hypothetical protein
MTAARRNPPMPATQMRQHVEQLATINGVPADQYGLWCQHGQRLLVPDPADTSDYPRCIPAVPWPCNEGCTPEGLAADMEEEAAEYERDRWNEYYDGIRDLHNHADDLPGGPGHP